MTIELYLDDSYLTTCKSEVIRIEGDKVILDQTVFYPTGGGQEHDLGWLNQGSQSVRVYKVIKNQGLIYHYVESTEKLSLGPVVAEIDWQRRYGFMRHHSLLHIVASVFFKQFGSRCIGNQVYMNRARIDLTGISEVDEEGIKNFLDESNHEINKNHHITARVLPREEAESISGSIKTVVSLIPKSVKDIRLIRIGNIDEQACGGTHVKQTSEIGKITLENIKRKTKGIIRLELRAEK